VTGRPADPAAAVGAGYRVTAFVLCLGGLVAAGYLTYEHFTGSTTLACSDTGAVNCLKVTTSAYSKVLGVPVALLGLIFFVVMTALCSPQGWVLSQVRPVVGRLRIVAAGVGVVSVFYLVWAELFRIDAICLWCTGVHVITVVLFGVLVFASASTSGLAPDPSVPR
jgi:uncharacterized membrane protein